MIAARDFKAPVIHPDPEKIVNSGRSLYSILVVEDERIVALDLVDTLHQLGYIVTASVSSGEAAIQEAVSLHPDLVLMDIRLAGAIDGIEAAITIKAKMDIPIIYLTAHSDDSTLARAKDTAPHGYVVKPFNSPELHCAIEVALHKHRIESEVQRSEKRYRTQVENSAALMCTHDLKGNLLSINAAAANALGYTMDQAVGRNIREFLSPGAHRNFDRYLKAIRKNQVASGNMPLITRDGQKLVWSYTNRLLRDAGKSAYVLGHAQDVTERLEMQKALLKSQRATLETERRLSRTDGLTGAANRRAFYETAEVERKRALRYGRPMSLAYIDLDNFKQVNDQSGHDSGDRVLVCVAEVLRKHNRAENLVARLGGDEFALLLPEAGQISAGVVINKLRGLLNNAMRENGWPVTFSIGVVTYDKPPENMEEMVQVADKLMYTVKREGKNKIGCSVVTLGQSNQSVHLSAAAQTEDAAAGARMTQNLPIDHQGTRA